MLNQDEMSKGQAAAAVTSLVIFLSNGIIFLAAQDPNQDFCQSLWSNACQNGGVCVAATTNDFECQCTEQFAGKTCSDLAVENACTNEPCLHGGICILLSGGSFTCDCTREFLGPLCEER